MPFPVREGRGGRGLKRSQTATLKALATNQSFDDLVTFFGGSVGVVRNNVPREIFIKYTYNVLNEHHPTDKADKGDPD